MLHCLSSYATGESEAVCRINELARELRVHNVPISSYPMHDQTCLRIRLPETSAESAVLSIAARTNQRHVHYEMVCLEAAR